MMSRAANCVMPCIHTDGEIFTGKRAIFFFTFGVAGAKWVMNQIGVKSAISLGLILMGLLSWMQSAMYSNYGVMSKALCIVLESVLINENKT